MFNEIQGNNLCPVNIKEISYALIHCDIFIDYNTFNCSFISGSWGFHGGEGLYGRLDFSPFPYNFLFAGLDTYALKMETVGSSETQRQTSESGYWIHSGHERKGST